MAQVTILDVPVDISGSGVRTLPLASAGTNRKQLVVIASGLTGSGVTVPTALVCDGLSATYEAGATVSGARTAITAFSFTDAQVAAFTARALTITGGDTTRRVILACTIQNTDQTVTNTNGVYDSGTADSAGSPVSCVRSANSFTFACAKVMLLASSTMANPTRVGTFSTASSRLSYGYQNDTANTSDTTFAHSSAKTYELVINFKEAVDGIMEVNGGNAVKNGSTFNSTVAGFATVTSGDIAGKALTGVSLSTNTVTATAANFVDGATFYEPDTSQVITMTGTASGGGGKTGTKTIPTSSPDGMTSVVIASPITADSTYIGSVYTLANGDRWVYPTLGGDFFVDADGKINALDAGAYVCWHWRVADSIMTQVTLNISEAGDIVSVGLTTAGLTNSGLTSAGLTSAGL